MADWGEDYSILVRGIEGSLSAHINSSPVLDKSLSLSSNIHNTSDSNQKRQRLSISSENPDDTDYMKRGNYMQSADRMKLTVQIDETRLLNEQLRDKLKGSVDEFGRYKEKTIKQLTFMEAENNQLKREAADHLDRYYDEKKKWQSRIRAVESEISLLSRKEGPSVDGALHPGTGGTALASITRGDKDVERKLLQLEENVRVKSNDMKQLSKINASLEERVVHLQQELLLSKVKIGQQVQADDDVLETRDFKKRCSDLETTLRRKTREFDRLERKIQNQSLLEEELSTTNIKLKLSQDQIEKFKHTESLYHSLLNEKSEWSVLFQGIINENEESSLESINELKNIQKVSSSSDINPSAVLRALGSIQKKYVLLLKSDHDLSESNKDLVNRLSVLDELLVKNTDEKKGSDYQIERASSRLRLAQQQTKLYEGEVVSLRALLQSFDVEFSIGRPSDSTLLKMKDEVIASLRDVIEKCRSEAKSLSIQNENLMADRDALIEIDSLVNQKGLTVDTIQGGIDKEGGSRESILKDELIALQMFTGVDFVPGKTKVLHLSDNPCSQALGSRANTGTSSLPREHLKRLLREAVKGGPPGVISVGGMDRSGENELFREDSEGGDISVAHNGTSMSAGASSTIADSNKLNQRLKEMFKDRITSFREAVYLLTGYKVDLYAADTTTGGHARLRLRSMYADNPEDSLLFQWRGDKLELMETPFASKLDSKLFTYLSTCNSVPCFLSNVTLDLFDNQTFLP